MENQKLNLLIVEENPFLVNVLRQALTPEFNVIAVANGIEALDRLEYGSRIDFILTEINLPKLDGLELIRLVRLNILYKHLPILVISKFEDSSSRIKCLESGADAYVAKPFNPLEVRARVRGMLRHTDSFSTKKATDIVPSYY
ncbi:response regulator [Tellurirhabdus bombi]|uniref:response regulator n=1 Tax=Tellurirhabdus bombi TaxID=2907205 RepID=UPI001F1634A0|nr:response regulator transcription factor [Tellurirhabdus bombi]